ncbi:fibrobacter succinogenes major paralogous domain-containing protein [Litoribacter alkaliphilus]|uniref:Fibrobacter succinogenes major paralogous domain-containing protein n=1 Tax=Litoribacter ruber TaxID=702568 RepID=A0AAP2CIB4_9BACT|nr:fibrobacter succinogenes major paralogous domain-containing protein [Litoribacter alkaliphilus]MBS9525273.1 fibrobacter succinogenes major paralogous domain-containing protein [Litoribacter alkaliphilus]
MKNLIFYIAAILFLTTACRLGDEEREDSVGDVNFQPIQVDQFMLVGEDSTLNPSEWRHVFPERARININHVHSGQTHQLDFNPNDEGVNSIELPFGAYTYTLMIEGGTAEDFLPVEASGSFVLTGRSINVPLDATTEHGLVTLKNQYVEAAQLLVEETNYELGLLDSEEHFYKYVRRGLPTQLQIQDNVNLSNFARNFTMRSRRHFHFYLNTPPVQQDPTDPTQPGEPSDPIYPINPIDPGEPDDPDEDPDDPDDEDPSGPDDPTDPDPNPDDPSTGGIRFVELAMGDFSYEERPVDVPGQQAENFVRDADGNSYRIIRIGNQYWMGENLRTTTYCNGDDIPEVGASNDWLSLNSGVYTRFNNSQEYGRPYGNYYTQEAVQDSRGLCPCGWKIPSNADWQQLISTLGGNAAAGGRMKNPTTDRWKYPNTGANNDSGFNAIGAGWVTVTENPDQYPGISGPYNWLYERGAWWSSTGNYFAQLYYNRAEVRLEEFYATGTANAFNVRCIRE